MIYTVTFNPSLDYIAVVENFKLGTVNRTEKEKIMCGGKGINVSIVLNNLGVESTALGFTSGFTGHEILRGLREKGCKEDFIEVDNGFSRINVKMKSKEETEINGQGPLVKEEDIQKLFEKLDKIKEDDILVLAGSIPNTLPEDIYEKIIERLDGRNIKIVVDATKDLLLNVLKYNPFLIKPNNHELGEMFGVVLKDKEEIKKYAIKLQDKGARNVLISMAGDGAVFISEKGEVYESIAPQGKVINSVGAGDSMVAGFITGYLENGDLLKAFKMGIAAGSASAFSEELATKEEVEVLLGTI